MNSKSVILSVFTILAASACNPIGAQYVGSFEGKWNQDDVRLEVAQNQIGVSVGSRSFSFGPVYEGFDGSFEAIRVGRQAVYALPSIESYMGVPVNDPWMVRSELSFGPQAKESDHLLDVFLILPKEQSTDPIHGVPSLPFVNVNAGEYNADIFCFQIDRNASKAASEITLRVAEDVTLKAGEISIPFFKTKMLNFGVSPDHEPKPFQLARVAH